MSLYFVNLDDRTRELMLEEVEYDISHNQLHISPILSGQGQRDYVNLLREAIQSGNDGTLAEHLKQHRRINKTQSRKNPKGGFSIAAVPANAAEVLAESEFNRFYIRALARRAIEEGIADLVVYRAKPVQNPRPQSEALIEATLPPQDLLADLRAHPDEPPTLGVPSGPNSGLSVRLP
jgi:hypothetical protein